MNELTASASAGSAAIARPVQAPLRRELPAELPPLLRGVDGAVAVLGAGGMLHRAWCELLDERGVRYRSLGLEDFDFTRPASVVAALGSRYRLVVNCAGYTDVDGAETNPALADAINGTAVGQLASHCAAAGAFLVHYSTDYVFSGETNRPYSVDDVSDPVNAYGRSKLLGERLLLNSRCRSLLIRTSWLYAPWARNFVRVIVDLAIKRRTLRVVDDQFGRPTSAAHLAQQCLDLYCRGGQGIFHITDAGMCSRYAFAAEIVRLAGLACAVEPCATDEQPRPARRPAFAVLDISQTETLLGPMPHWTQNLAQVMRRLAVPVPAAEPVAVGG